MSDDTGIALSQRAQYGIAGTNYADTMAAEALTGAYLNPTGIFLSFDSTWTAHTEITNYGSNGSGGTARVLYFTWLPSRSNSAVLMTSISSGGEDAHLTQILTGVKNYPGQVVIRFGHEMNINTSQWSTTYTGAFPGTFATSEYVAAWQYVHAFAATMGVTNAKWFWCPNGGDSSGNVAENYYPGDSYVDIIGFDSYNGYGSWTSWYNTIQPYYDRYVLVNATADVWIGETGCVEDASGINSKAQWLASMFSDTNFARLKVVNYFDAKGGRDWRWTTSASATNAVIAGLQAAAFTVKKGAPPAQAVDPSALPLAEIRTVPLDLSFDRQRFFDYAHYINLLETTSLTTAYIGIPNGISSLDSGKNVQTYTSVNFTTPGTPSLTQNGITALKFNTSRALGIGAIADLGTGSYTLSIPEGTSPSAAPSTGAIFFVTNGRLQVKLTDGSTRYIARPGGTLTLAAGVNNGGSPPTPTGATGSDSTAGVISFGSGTAPTGGAQIVVSFTALAAAPRHIGLTPWNAATAALGTPYIVNGSVANTGFTIGFNAAPAASQAATVYGVSYHVYD